MKKRLFIAKEDLPKLIKDLKSGCDEFIAPTRGHLDDIIFCDTKSDKAGELLDFSGNSVISPRAFLLPQTEPLFRITSARRGDLTPIKDEKKRIFYGVRPCDIKALVLMREFFVGEEFTDEPYKAKLERSVFISLACGRKCAEKAFCYEMGSGPVAKEGFDIQLTGVSGGFIVDVGTKKGGDIVRKNKRLFKDANPKHEKDADSIVSDFAKGAKRFDHKRLAALMADDKVRPEIWEDIGLRCVVCSGCITLCPTCSCFSVVDKMNGDSGMRVRYCDGCPYAGFTRMAGGSTPFPLHKDHIRRYFEHKLNHDVDRYGTPSCVGCSRCIQTCPGNISIRKFIEDSL